MLKSSPFSCTNMILCSYNLSPARMISTYWSSAKWNLEWQGKPSLVFFNQRELTLRVELNKTPWLIAHCSSYVVNGSRLQFWLLYCSYLLFKTNKIQWRNLSDRLVELTDPFHISRSHRKVTFSLPYHHFLRLTLEQKFPFLAPVNYFLALDTCSMFFRACHPLKVFPRFLLIKGFRAPFTVQGFLTLQYKPPVTYFPTLATHFMLSCACNLLRAV